MASKMRIMLEKQADEHAKPTGEHEKLKAGPGPRRRTNPLAMYKRSMSRRPLLTKCVTAATVAAFGEVIGTMVRQAKTHATAAASSSLSSSSAVASQGARGLSVANKAAGPGLLRRTLAFALFGFVFNGPVFHWWYGELERIAARQRRPGETPGNAKEVMLKVACDRLLLTPPFLAFTLFALRVLQGFGAARSAKEAAAIFRGALLTNWKVWTVAQLLNFNLVPVEFRPVFGNVVACWWNLYLSLLAGK